MSVRRALPTKIIAVTGGKGGVGKSTVSINLAAGLAARGQRVALLDGDLGLANLDVMLGLKPRLTLDDVIAGQATIEEVMLSGPEGIKVVPAGSGVTGSSARRLAALGPLEQSALVDALTRLDEQFDVFMLDTAAGISDLVMHFVRAASEIVVVVCNEPSSITDAYALIKVANREFGMHRFRVVANQVRDTGEARRLYQKLCTVSDRFLDVALLPCVAIAYDESVKRAVRKQKAVIEAYPSSSAARAFMRLAEQVAGWPRQGDGSDAQSLVERLLGGEMQSTGAGDGVGVA